MNKKDYVMPLLPIEQEIIKAVAPVLATQGCELVRICVSGSKNMHVEVFVDNFDNKLPICVKKLQQLHPLVQDIISVVLSEKLSEGNCYLQVSSPGLDRPLTRLRHFQEALGKPVRVRFAYADREKTQTGVLLDVQEGGIVLEDLDESAARSLLLQWHEMQEVVSLHDFSHRVPRKPSKKLSVAARRGKSCLE